MWRKSPSPALIFVLLVMGFGSSRLQNPGIQPRAVGLITADANIANSWRTEDPQQAVAIAKRWSDRIARVAAQGAFVIVLPEKLLAITPADRQQVYSVFAGAARKSRRTVVAGFNFLGITPPRNIAVVFSPEGDRILTYDKHHMLQGPETGYLSGKETAVFVAAGFQWGVEICKDLDYPALSRQYGKQDIRYLAVPAWDFIRDAWLHDRMAVMRGVENGFTVVRTAQQGLLTISDAYGRVVAQRTSYSAPEVTLVRAVQTGPGTTLYAKFGDWFGWLNLLALAAITLTLGIRRKKRSAGVT
jgi:apolipoprotein N-acyltransferase